MRTLLVLVVFVFASACASPQLAPPTPKGFVEIEGKAPYHYRAVTADGLVIAARAIDHEPKGEIGFWTEAVGNQLRRAGYALLDERDVKTTGGMAGKQLRFGHDEGQRPHLYFVTLFVTEGTIYVLEAGGTREQVEKRAADIDWAVANFRP